MGLGGVAPAAPVSAAPTLALGPPPQSSVLARKHAVAPHVATPVVLVIDPPAQSSVLADERAVAPPVLSRPPVGNPVQALSVQPNTAPCQKGGVEQRIVRDKESAYFHHKSATILASAGLQQWQLAWIRAGRTRDTPIVLKSSCVIPAGSTLTMLSCGLWKARAACAFKRNCCYDVMVFDYDLS